MCREPVTLSLVDRNAISTGSLTLRGRERALMRASVGGEDDNDGRIDCISSGVAMVSTRKLFVCWYFVHPSGMPHNECCAWHVFCFDVHSFLSLLAGPCLAHECGQVPGMGCELHGIAGINIDVCPRVLAPAGSAFLASSQVSKADLCRTPNTGSSPGHVVRRTATSDAVESRAL